MDGSPQVGSNCAVAYFIQKSRERQTLILNWRSHYLNRNSSRDRSIVNNKSYNHSGSLLGLPNPNWTPPDHPICGFIKAPRFERLLGW